MNSLPLLNSAHHTSGHRCIGVFDSGVGGLSVLSALRQRLPNSPMIYIGDVAHAPYGELSAERVIARSHCIVRYLVSLGATTIVVACNTATVSSIASLRERWPALTFVGVEPGVKPAAACSRTGRIAIMVTAMTARSARLRQLIHDYAKGLHVHIEPCPSLASLIERGALQDHELDAALNKHCAAVRKAKVDMLVLGCTHYSFVADAIKARLNGTVTWVDTAPAIAEQVARVWSPGPRSTPAKSLLVISTGASDGMESLLSRCDGVETVDVARIEL